MIKCLFLGELLVQLTLEGSVSFNKKNATVAHHESFFEKKKNVLSCLDGT